MTKLAPFVSNVKLRIQVGATREQRAARRIQSLLRLLLLNGQPLASPAAWVIFLWG